MTDCLMYNIILENYHPSTICVELSRVPESLEYISQVIDSPHLLEEIPEFIEKFARKDQIMPSDRTVGFLVLHQPKKNMAISLGKVEQETKDRIKKSADLFRNIKFNVELDF